MAPDPTIKLKAARTGKLSSLTKRIIKMDELINSNAEPGIVSQLKEEIIQVFSECRTTNEKYIETLEEEIEMTAAYEWLSVAEERVSECKLKIFSYLDKWQLQSGTNSNSLDNGKSSSTSKPDPCPTALDRWIDDLTPFQETSVVSPDVSNDGDYQKLMLRAMFERDAPKPELDSFDGSAIEWPRFVETFHEIVHRQPYFKDVRRMAILQGSVKGRAKSIVSGFGNDGAAYALALKELKKWCGHPSFVSRAFISRIINGGLVMDNRGDLHQFYISIRDCIFTLKRMQYQSELMNTELVREATARLPSRLRNSWAGQCYRIRSKFQRDPTIVDMEEWLSVKVSALYDPVLPDDDDDALTKSFRQGPPDEKKPAFRQGLPEDQSKPPPSQDQKDNTNPTNHNPRYCNFHKSSGHWTRSCYALKSKTVEDQVEWFVNSKVCRLCLGTGHKIDGTDCPISERLPNCLKCERKHHVYFHDAMEVLREKPDQLFVLQNFGTSVNFRYSLSPAILGQLSLSSKTKMDIGVLLDTGSVITLISLRVVKLANLVKASEKATIITMETVGGNIRSIEAYPYNIPLVTETGTLNNIIGYGVEKIGSKFSVLAISAAAAVMDIDPAIVKYPSGFSLDLLVGIDNAHLCHPTIIKSSVTSEHSLVFGRTPIGHVIFGSHQSFSRDGKPGHFRTTAYGTKTCNITDLYNTEVMGVECSPKCGSCKCGQCAAGSGHLSLKEESEYQAIRNLLKLENAVVVADYPWVRDPSSLPDHYSYALKRLFQFENRMLKSPNLLEMFRKQFQKMLETDVYRRLTTEEDEAWRSDPANPVHYLPYREVLKPTSTTTPLRIILDPASSPDGVCINDYWATGPNIILNPFGLQIRHREEAVAIGNDINRMYNEVRTVPLIYHCHRILYRDFDQTKEPETYIVVRNSFGSRPSGTVAIAATHMVAEAGKENHPLGAKMIMEQSYVDDLLDSKPDMATASETMRQTEECLILGSFTLKKWTVVDANNLMNESSSVDSIASVQIGKNSETVLGVHWELSTDSFKFVPKLNFSKKKRKLHTGPDLEKGEIFQHPDPLTLRSILSQVNGFYDPLGLVAPYICELKFALGKLWKVMKPQENSKVLWDKPIPLDCDLEWRKLLNSAFEMKSLRFPRLLRPSSSVGNPWLVIMTDSSMRAFGACAYIRWKLNDESYFCRLMSAKSRVWPIEPNDFISLCRGELQGLVLGKRLAVTILSESRLHFERTIFILDSEIVRAQVSKDSHAFDTFVANRVGEIRSKFIPDQFYTVSGDVNVSADLLSRGTTDASKMDCNSPWQNGPTMLYKDFEEWPISQKYTSSAPLPESRDFTFNQKVMKINITDSDMLLHEFQLGDCTWTEAIAAWNSYLVQNSDESELPVRTTFTDVMENEIAKSIDLSRYSKLTKLLAVTFRVLHALSWKPGSGHFAKFITSLEVVNSEQLELSRQFWIRHAQRQIANDISSGKYKTLNPVKNLQTKIWYLNGRFGDNPQGYHPIILPNNHIFVHLLVRDIHSRNHCGVTATIAKVRDEYHILNVKNLAKMIRKDCTMCRKIAKTLVKVPMAPYPVERFRPAYAFEHSSCDLFGPFLLQVPGRVTRGRPMDYYGKGYGLIFTCLSSRAIHLEAMEGQDTSAFLMSLRRFISIRGQPRSMWSDNGSQIVAADQELRDIVRNWDEKKLKEFGAQNGIKFQYAAPAAPWQNGVSESLIRSVKNSLIQTTSSSKPRLPVMHLQTIFYEVSAVLNERPINLGHNELPDDWDSETNVYLCPNQLLLGRSSVRIPSGPFSVSQSKHSELFHEVEKIVNDWWQYWLAHYVPTLLKQSKWHSESRQVRVGDIVYAKDDKAVRSDWKIAEISKLLPSEKDGRIRNVEIRYRVLPDEPLLVYSGCKDRLEIRDVKTLVILLTAEERNFQ